MKARIVPGSFNGTVNIPPSKSLTQRAYAAALLYVGTTLIHNAGNSADEEAARHMIQQLGATVTGSGPMVVTSKGIAPVSDTIDCGESGLAARLFAPIAALHNSPITIAGHGSILRRPMEGVADILPLLSVSLQGFNGHIPFTVQGPMQARSVAVHTSGSSQLLSGLLFALCACATAPITITVAGLQSKPYIDLTLDVLAHFGRHVSHDNYKVFHIDPARFEYAAHRELTIEADWSSASCMLVAGAIAGEVTVPNLFMNSRQADRAILDVLRTIGADMDITDTGITVRRSRMQGFEFDAANCPDLFPALAALASFCDGNSQVTGVHRLFHKESNRVESITEMLWRYGVTFSVEDDTLYIEGREKVQYSYMDGYKDHRIVMAAAVCALRAKGPVTISCADAVGKSYPRFFDDMRLCGVACELLP
ncbi:3-phosphoshikimate 1-carboxyvinyltransferase [Nemorincola caseinilytica]|uniref:3-phosphoshikimate 1-carboxyvinyltransferase n=1 Tax=Nemorincola caseinilytica TaxID=2054315 RepID=A0ABP8NAY2_9BACT